MQARNMRSAPAEHLEDLAYLTAHLKADPLAQEIASDVEAESATLQSQIEDWSSKRHAVQETQTALGNMNETLRNAVRHAHDVILDDLRRNRRSPNNLGFRRPMDSDESVGLKKGFDDEISKKFGDD